MDFSWILDCLISLIDQGFTGLPGLLDFGWFLSRIGNQLVSLRTLDFGFSLDLSSFDLGLVFLRTWIGIAYQSYLLNDTNIQSDSNQRKRINAIFPGCRFYGYFRRTTNTIPGLSLISLDAS